MQTIKAAFLKEIAAWLEALSALAATAETTNGLPQVELMLKNGISCRGVVLAFEKRENVRLVMMLKKANTNQQEEMMLLDSAEIIAISFMDYHSLLRKHHGEQREKLGALELSRNIKAIEQQLQQLAAFEIKLSAGESIPEDARWDVYQTAKRLVDVFAAITTDDLGKNLLKEKIQTITITEAPTNAIDIDNRSLKIQIVVPITASPKEALALLQKNIESIL
jgi:hypothetical protein